MHALIDADVLVYYASVVNDDKEDVSWGEEIVTEERMMGGVSLFEDKLAEWLRLAGTDDYTLVFSGKSSEDNFRRAIHPEYKRNRTTPKPVIYGALRELVEDAYGCHSWWNLEGDDVLGILSGPDTMIVSTDKDIRTLPGRLLHIAHPSKTQQPWFINSVAQADRYWMTQTLTGDTTDGYRGCPGVGPARAKVLLNGVLGVHDMWNVVLEEYRTKALDKRWGKKFFSSNYYKEALANAQVARILRAREYDFDIGVPKLWRP
jgi:DNA polymerase-1